MDNNNASAFTAVETGMYDYNIRLIKEMSVKEPYLPLILPPLNVPAKDLPSVGVTSRLLLPSSGKNWLASHD